MPPSSAHLMGTDNFGRDIFSRVLAGMGTTFFISLCTVAIGGAVGTLVGAFTGYFGGVAGEVAEGFLFRFPFYQESAFCDHLLAFLFPDGL